MKRIVVLGSTGSIGVQTLDVVRALPERFAVVGLAAGWNHGLLESQLAGSGARMAWDRGGGGFRNGARRVSMEDMVTEPDVDLVMVATTGRAGLAPTLAALRAGKQVALANKEVIVMAGELVTETAREHGAALLPVDSEPSAIWQCLRGEELPARKLILTASGGPFRTRPLAEIAGATPDEALAHPTWAMGRKISVDSATLMNKGFEVIECHWLFSVPYERIEVVVHPQSVVHSMVELADGSVKAQLGPPDMRLHIQHALSYPDRLANATLPRFSALDAAAMTFEPLDEQRYPCFPLALEAGRLGGTYPAVLSAADEVAVQRFLDGRIGFGDIHAVVAGVLDRHETGGDASLEAVLAADDWARREIGEAVRA